MNLLKEAIEYLGVMWFRTAYGANTQFMVQVVAPVLSGM